MRTAEDDDAGFVLMVRDDGLVLREAGARSGGIRVDFLSAEIEHRRRHGGGKGQLIARAVGIGNEPLHVLDATAGLGRDAFVLAALGCRVTAVERNPVLAVMFEDALDRAGRHGSPAVRRAVERITLINRDAHDVLDDMAHAMKGAAASAAAIDVVYLDPMYPSKRKESALVRKEMRVCRMLVGEDTDASGLVDIALAVARNRVVVKRRREAPPLRPRPTIVYERGHTRYDVYAKRQNAKTPRRQDENAEDGAPP